MVSGQFYQKKGAQAEQPASAEENFSGNSEQAEVLSEQAENAEESQQTQAAEVLAEEPADSEDERQ